MGKRALVVGVGALAALAVGTAAGAQQVHELKLGHYAPGTHFFAKYLKDWADELKQKSSGRLVITIFDGAQMGPTPRYYDLVRTGVADIGWLLHGATPGRFPLTELISLPFAVGSAEIGTKVLNEPEILTYLAEEHRGVRILYLLTHQPGNLHTRAKPVHTVEDLKGQRIRFASATIKEYVAALGGTPVGVPPPEIAEALQKSTIDGVFIDYGGAHTAFKLGGLVKYTTEMYSYVASFAVVMNPDSYAKLPPDLQRLIDDTTRNVAGPIGRMWDAADAPGKRYLMSEGAQLITLSPAQEARFREVGAQVSEKIAAELSAKGLPARQVHDLMRKHAARHAESSFSFWKK